MKVEYLLQLWKSFNKKIWANKQFALFLYIFVILGTVLLRQSPSLYYGFLDNSVYLTLIVLVILALSMHNMTLGILLTLALLALYYPSQIRSVEGFEEETTEVDPTDDNIDNGDDEAEKEEEKPKKKEKTKKKTKKKEEDSLDIRGLEDLNPEFYKRDTDQGEEADDEADQESTPAPTRKPREKESFLGEVREVFYDLDSGKSKMNVKGAVKKITDLVYHKRRNEIEDILREEDDDSETSSDEDYF